MSNQLWMLTGGNGAGKSTFHWTRLLPLGLQMLSVDETARRISPLNPNAAISDAQQWVDKERSLLLERSESFCYETVFSHPSRIDFVAEAKAQGYDITLIYIHLETSELNQARVKQRVSEGGHDVPPEKIISRIPRTMKHVATALALANSARILDNSSYEDPFKTIAVIVNGQITSHVHPLPGWAAAMLTSFV